MWNFYIKEGNMKKAINLNYTARKDPSLNSLQFDIDVLSYCLSHFYWRIYPHKRQFLILLDLMICTYFTIWQYGLSIFQAGDTKLERFLPKNQHTQRKWLNFENWCNEKVSKSAKIWLSKSIFYVKNHRNLHQLFFNLGAHFW